MKNSSSANALFPNQKNEPARQAPDTRVYRTGLSSCSGLSSNCRCCRTFSLIANPCLLLFPLAVAGDVALPRAGEGADAAGQGASGPWTPGLPSNYIQKMSLNSTIQMKTATSIVHKGLCITYV